MSVDRQSRKILVTGGAGFIGSALIRYLLNSTNSVVLNVDKLTYAGDLESLAAIEGSSRYGFERADICDKAAIERIVADFQPDFIMHLAAESHVDQSIHNPGQFVETNIVGTANLLEIVRGYWSGLNEPACSEFRFHHISTDEVYGDLEPDQPAFTEESRYLPSSPYSASKAASDHLVRAWHRTYGLPVVLSNCSNNFGPYQFPEKLIPLMILNALNGKPLPVYGNGHQVRDWLYVEDHARALYEVLTRGRTGETYNIGSHQEKKNIDVVNAVCDLLEELADHKPAGIKRFHDLITHVTDRPGHDSRYAVNAGKLQRELGWQSAENFETGLRKTVQWYLDNLDWCERLISQQ